MKTNIARVCQIGTTTYVDYKGERLTVEEYKAKYGVDIKIPKEVKLCKPTKMVAVLKETGEILGERKMLDESKFPYGGKAIPAREVTPTWKPPVEHGSRAKKADTAHMNVKRMNLGEQEGHFIDIPKNLRRVEGLPLRQWVKEKTMTKSEITTARVFLIVGTTLGAVLGFLLGFLASLIIHSLQH